MSDLEAILSLDDEDSATFDGFSPKEITSAQRKLDKKKVPKKDHPNTRSTKSKKREKCVTFVKNIETLSDKDVATLRDKLGLGSNTGENEQTEQTVHVHEDSFESDLMCHDESAIDVSQDWFQNSHNETKVDDWQTPKLKIPERGAPIKESLANLIGTAFTAQCATEDIVSRYKVPSNCDKIEAPLVNMEVWGEVNKKAHSDDKQIKGVQNFLSAGVLPLIKLAEDPKINSSKEVRGCLQDALTLLGQAQFNLSLRRRYQLRPHLKSKYSKLCSINTPVTTNLFGDDLAKELKRCESAVRISKDNYWQPQSRGRGGYGFRRYNPYPIQSGRRGYSHGFRGSYAQRGFTPRGRGGQRPPMPPSATAPNPNVGTGN